jgi:hypothetical protein
LRKSCGETISARICLPSAGREVSDPGNFLILRKKYRADCALINAGVGRKPLCIHAPGTYGKETALLAAGIYPAEGK